VNGFCCCELDCVVVRQAHSATSVYTLQDMYPGAIASASLRSTTVMVEPVHMARALEHMIKGVQLEVCLKNLDVSGKCFILCLLMSLTVKIACKCALNLSYFLV
jgi:hypothetical protein